MSRVKPPPSRCTIGAGMRTATALLVLLLAPPVFGDELEQRFQELVARLADEDVAQRDAAGAQIEKLGEPVLGLLDRAAAGTKDPEVQVRLQAIAGRIRRGGRLRWLEDVWFRRADGAGYRHMETERETWQGRDAWCLTDTIVVRDGETMNEEKAEAWTDTDDVFTLLEANWSASGVIPGGLGRGRLEVSVSKSGEWLIPRLRKAELEDARAAMNQITGLMRDAITVRAPKPKTWFRAMPRVAALLDPGAVPADFPERLSLPLNDPMTKQTEIRWGPEEELEIGGEKTAARCITFFPDIRVNREGNPDDYHLDDEIWVDARGRVLKIRERGSEWLLSAGEEEARKGVDR